MSASPNWDKIPDGELAARVRAGDVAAFDDVVKRYSPVILGFFLKELGPDQFEQAEDLTSETMVASWVTLRSGRSALPENVKAWLFGTAKHILSRHFKEKCARGEVLAFEPETYDPEDPKSLDDFREVEYEQGLPRFLKLVDEAIESMPVKYREVIRINMRDSSTGQALAAQVGVTPAEASRRLNEARPRLANAVGTLLMARTCREACPKLDSYLQIAGWAGGPFSEELRQRLMQHISSCATCMHARKREMNWISILPVTVPVLVASELHQRILKIVFTAHEVSLSSASDGSGGPFDGSGGSGGSSPQTVPAQSGCTHDATGASNSFADIPGDSGETADSSNTFDDKGNNDSAKFRAKAILSASLIVVLLIALGIFTVKIYESTGAIMDRAVPAPLNQPEPLVTKESVSPSEDNPGPATPIGDSSPEPLPQAPPPPPPALPAMAPPPVAPPPAVVVPPPVVMVPPPPPPVCDRGQAWVNGVCRQVDHRRCDRPGLKWDNGVCKRVDDGDCSHSLTQAKGVNSACKEAKSSTCDSGQVRVNGTCTSRPGSLSITKPGPLSTTKTTPAPPKTTPAPPRRPETVQQRPPTRITPAPPRRPETVQQRPPARTAPGPQRRPEAGQQHPPGRTAPGRQRPG